MQSGPHLTLPDAEQFRVWLTRSLEILDLRAHRLGELSGVGKNAARKFLKGEQADLRLNTASALVHGARAHASTKGVDLPPLPDALDGPVVGKGI